MWRLVKTLFLWGRPAERAFFSLGLLIFTCWLFADSIWVTMFFGSTVDRFWLYASVAVMLSALVAAALAWVYLAIQLGIYLGQCGQPGSRFRLHWLIWGGLVLGLGCWLLQKNELYDFAGTQTPEWLKNSLQSLIYWRQYSLKWTDLVAIAMIYLGGALLPIPEAWRHSPRTRRLALAGCGCGIGAIVVSLAVNWAVLVSVTRLWYDYRGREMGFEPDEVSAAAMKLLESSRPGWFLLISVGILFILGTVGIWGKVFSALDGRTVWTRPVRILALIAAGYAVTLQCGSLTTEIFYHRELGKLRRTFDRPLDLANMREYYLNGRPLRKDEFRPTPWFPDAVSLKGKYWIVLDDSTISDAFVMMTPKYRENWLALRELAMPHWSRFDAACEKGDYDPSEPNILDWAFWGCDGRGPGHANKICQRLREINRRLRSELFLGHFEPVRKQWRYQLAAINALEAEGRFRGWSYELREALDNMALMMEEGILSTDDAREMADLIGRWEREIPTVFERNRYLGAVAMLEVLRQFDDGTLMHPGQNRGNRYPVPMLTCRLLLPVPTIFLRLDLIDAFWRWQNPAPEGGRRWGKLVGQFKPDIEPYISRRELAARLRTTRKLLEVYEAVRSGGEWPERVEGLPEDPFTGKPMLYRKGDCEVEVIIERKNYSPCKMKVPAVQVWSVGLDGRDGDGVKSYEPKRDDIRAIVRLRPEKVFVERKAAEKVPQAEK